MGFDSNWIPSTADRLASLYGEAFGGKSSGRYRIPVKLVREIAGRRRLYERDVRDLTQALLERGFVLIDMDGFYVVMSANAFVNYRRVSEHCLT